MKAVVFQEFGGPETLSLSEAPTPAPASDEVLIRISHAGVNPIDWKIRMGLYKDMFPYRFPIIAGFDAAGTVSAIGKGVSSLDVGDRVYAYCQPAMLHDGTYAEFIAVKAALVARMPARLSFAEGASVPLSLLTSWQALYDFAKLKRGDAVLIHAGAGGVGSYAIQLAKYVGATVYTTVSKANQEYVKSLGADVAIDYATEDFVHRVRDLAGGGIDVVFDTLGGETQSKSYAVLKPGGILVSVVQPPAVEEAERYQVKAGFTFTLSNGDQLGQISTLFESGALRPIAIEELALTDAAEAHRKSQSGHVRGKIVLKIG